VAIVGDGGTTGSPVCIRIYLLFRKGMMSASPAFKIFKNNKYIGCVKNPIYALRMFFDDWENWDIRLGHQRKTIIWDKTDVQFLYNRDGEINFDNALSHCYSKLSPALIEHVRDF
tara:strand:+ start:104 stop:448 length:345 start_codon:yes stop_codon:yes gene_type:complete